MFPIAGLFEAVLEPAVKGIFGMKADQAKVEITKAELELKLKQLEADVKIRMMEEQNKPDSEFRQFMLEYEGKASELPPWVAALRAAIRPLVTIWSVAMLTWIMVDSSAGTTIGANLEGMPSEIWWIFLTVFGFWFGGRAAMQVVDVVKKGEKGKIQTETTARVREAAEVTRQTENKVKAAHHETETEKLRTRRTIVGQAGGATRPVTASTPWPDEQY